MKVRLNMIDPATL